MIYVPGMGNPKAKLMIVGECPSELDTRSKVPFSGPSGSMLFEILQELGIPKSEVWFTNVYKYQPPANNLKRISEVCNPAEELEKFWNEVKDINPNCILSLGEESFKAIQGHGGIQKWRGSILKSRSGDRKLVGTIHPANISRSSAQGEYGGSSYTVYNYIWRSIIKLDIQRAWEESKSPDIDYHEPFIKTCRDSMELYKFISANRHREKMSVDIESHNCTPIVVGLSFDQYEARVVPLFNRLGPLNIGGIPASDQSSMWQMLNELFKTKKIIGQNFKYDQDKLQMIGFSFNKQRPVWSDTMIKAHTINPELPSKSMEMLQSIWTRMPYHKDEGKEFDYRKHNIEKLFHYCGLDVLSTFETDRSMDDDLREMSELYHTNLVSFFYDYKMLLHRVYMGVEAIGFRIDEEFRDELKAKYQTRHDFIQSELNTLVPEFTPKGKKCHPDHIVNIASPPQMKELLYGHLGLPARKTRGKLASDEDTIVALLGNAVKNERQKRVLTLILEDRKVRKTLGTYVLAKPDFDGRIRCSYRITGTETGRTSTAILKQPLRPYKSGHAFQTLTKHGEIGSDIRKVYIVDPGYVFCQVDLSQAEPRIVALLSRDEKLLAAFRSGKVDIHRRTAALVLGMMSELDLSENYIEIADSIPKDSPQRFLGKTSRNGGNYDMGKRELMINIATQAKAQNMDLNVSEWRAGKMLDSFHAQSPNIRGVFHKEIREALDSTRVLVNPYGKVRTFFGRLGEKGTYGEGYAELPQGTVSDHVKHSILRTEKEMPDFSKMLMGESHDALFMRFPFGEEIDRARVVKKVMEMPIDFSGCTLSRGLLSIPVDVEFGYENYRDLVKAKL